MSCLLWTPRTNGPELGPKINKLNHKEVSKFGQILKFVHFHKNQINDKKFFKKAQRVTDIVGWVV